MATEGNGPGGDIPFEIRKSRLAASIYDSRDVDSLFLKTLIRPRRGCLWWLRLVTVRHVEQVYVMRSRMICHFYKVSPSAPLRALTSSRLQDLIPRPGPTSTRSSPIMTKGDIRIGCTRTNGRRGDDGKVPAPSRVNVVPRPQTHSRLFAAFR